MKYLEQRVEQLEKEVNLLKAKNKLKETKSKSYTSQYINNYLPLQKQTNEELNDYLFNSSVNLLAEPDLETTFASPFDRSEIKNNSLDTVSSTPDSGVLVTSKSHITCPSCSFRIITNNVTLSSNNEHANTDYVDSFDCPSYYPEYPNIIGSWDDKAYQEAITNPLVDECGFKYNHEDVVIDASPSPWNFNSQFDKMDKDFLNWLKAKKSHFYAKFKRQYEDR